MLIIKYHSLPPLSYTIALESDYLAATESLLNRPLGEG